MGFNFILLLFFYSNIEFAIILEVLPMIINSVLIKYVVPGNVTNIV